MAIPRAQQLKGRRPLPRQEVLRRFSHHCGTKSVRLMLLLRCLRTPMLTQKVGKLEHDPFHHHAVGVRGLASIDQSFVCRCRRESLCLKHSKERIQFLLEQVVVAALRCATQTLRIRQDLLLDRRGVRDNYAGGFIWLQHRALHRSDEALQKHPPPLVRRDAIHTSERISLHGNAARTWTVILQQLLQLLQRLQLSAINRHETVEQRHPIRRLRKSSTN
mmetsp:Transcript_85854/g.277195  ORF Transcript_85854/g.277195 Transcript_85854/m.277195 type:complete len:219 (-) Transcript_85854:77-733(-)